MLQCKHLTQHQCATPIDIHTHRQKIHEQYHTHKGHNIFALPTIILRPSESGEHNEAVTKIITHTHYSRGHSTNLCMLYVCTMKMTTPIHTEEICASTDQGRSQNFSEWVSQEPRQQRGGLEGCSMRAHASSTHRSQAPLCTMCERNLMQRRKLGVAREEEGLGTKLRKCKLKLLTNIQSHYASTTHASC